MSLHYMPESVSHPFNSLRVGLGTLRPLKAWKTDRGGCLEGTVHEVGDRDGRYTLKSTQRECGRAAEQLNGAGRSEEQARDGKSDR